MSSSVAPTLKPVPEPALGPFPELLPSGDPNPELLAPVGVPIPLAEAGLPEDVKRHVLTGTSAMGASVALERGAGFLANILAARFGGLQTFGAYSFALNTATNISTYAAGGIGATAARFSGKYPQGSAGYPSLMRALAVISLVSAAVAAGGLWLGAGPIAHFLGKESFVILLRCAWVSCAGVVLLECARGFLVGQRFVAALLTMSLTVGVGMVFLLPYAAHRHAPTLMVELQGSIALAAVLLCVLAGRRLGWRQPKAAVPQPRVPGVLGEVWSFGLMQLAGLIGSNLAGWWTTALVAKADTTLVQVTFFAVASQMRNLVSLPPSLLTEGSTAVLADPTHQETQTPQRVMALCCFASLALCLLLGAAGIVVVPWGLTLIYGRSYLAGAGAVAVALAVAVAHMGTAPAAARLSIVSIRAAAVINTVWAIFVATASTLVLLHGGGAWRAMAIFFCAHVLSSLLTLATLKRWDRLPAGLLPFFTFCAASMALLVVLSLWRGRGEHEGLITIGMLGVYLASAAGVYLFGKQYRWLPPASAYRRLLARLPNPLRREASHV